MEIARNHMGSFEDKGKAGGLVSGAQTLFEEMKLLKEMQDHSGQSLWTVLVSILLICI